MRVTSGVATTTAGAEGGTGSAAERHPLRLVLAIARHKSHELGGWHLRPVTCDGMSDDLRVDDQSTTIASSATSSETHYFKPPSGQVPTCVKRLQPRAFRTTRRG